jgi:hypothetical protein
MKFNWVNLLATLLIIGGVALLIQRHFIRPPAPHAPTVQEAKADIERQVENKLGRSLSEPETEMIEVNKVGDQINITLHQPLYGRLEQAIRSARAATQPGAQGSSPPGSDLTPPTSGYLDHDPSLAPMPAANPNPTPTTGLP